MGVFNLQAKKRSDRKYVNKIFGVLCRILILGDLRGIEPVTSKMNAKTNLSTPNQTQLPSCKVLNSSNPILLLENIHKVFAAAKN
jgi:hypothetical protein